jgi:hypothetical protein
MSGNTECDPAKLISFGRKVYTYINGYFGNEGVRQIIMERYPSRKYVLKTAHAEGFDDPTHHIVHDLETGQDICSARTTFQQNITEDTEDTLCQTYSLLMYMSYIFPDRDYSLPSRPSPKSRDINLYKREKQQKMIKMYRDLLSDPTLIDALTSQLHHPSDYLFNFTQHDNGIKFKSKVTTREWLRRVSILLDEWEKYGFNYFINRGNCPPNKRKSEEVTTQEYYDSDNQPPRTRQKRGGKNTKKIIKRKSKTRKTR